MRIALCDDRPDQLENLRSMILAWLQVIRNDLTGQTRLAGYTYDPIYTVYDGNEAQVLQMVPAIRDYEANGISTVSEEVYTAMTKAVTKVETLFTPEPEDDE